MSGCPTPRMSSIPPTPQRPPTIPFCFNPHPLHLLPIRPFVPPDEVTIPTYSVYRRHSSFPRPAKSPRTRPWVDPRLHGPRSQLAGAPSRSSFPGGFGIIFGRAQTVLPAVSKVKLNVGHRLAGQGNYNMRAAFRRQTIDHLITEHLAHNQQMVNKRWIAAEMIANCVTTGLLVSSSSAYSTHSMNKAGGEASHRQDALAVVTPGGCRVSRHLPPKAQ